MKRTWLIAALALGGCEKNLLPNGVADAALDTAAPLDAALTSCPQPAMPLAPGHYKLYLNADGPLLMSGCGDVARNNCTSLITTSPTKVPQFLPDETDPATRQAFIAQIAAAVQSVMAPYSLDVVTTQPASGDYEMIVLGGDATIAGGGIGVGTVATFECNIVRNSIALVFDFGETQPADEYAIQILSDLGTMLGLVASTAPNDCECRIDDCAGAGPLCSFGSNAPTTNMLLNASTPFNCGITPTEDEPALLAAALGCR